MKNIETVVCLHGFWSHGTGMYLIKRRLENEYGMRAILFSYPSVRGTLDDNAAALADFHAPRSTLKAHILSATVSAVLSALRMLANYRGHAPPGRVVCLGSPVTGSRSAEFLSRQDWAEPIMGLSLSEGCGRGSRPATWASRRVSRRVKSALLPVMPPSGWHSLSPILTRKTTARLPCLRDAA